MEKGFVVKRVFKVLGCPSGDFTYITSVFRNRNEAIQAIKVFSLWSKDFTLQRLSKNEWVEFPSNGEVGSVTEISLIEVVIY